MKLNIVAIQVLAETDNTYTSMIAVCDDGSLWFGVTKNFLQVEWREANTPIRTEEGRAA